MSIFYEEMKTAEDFKQKKKQELKARREDRKHDEERVQRVMDARDKDYSHLEESKEYKRADRFYSAYWNHDPKNGYDSPRYADTIDRRHPDRPIVKEYSSLFNSNKSELVKSLNEANSDIMSEYDLQYSINELASILRKAPSLDKKIRYTAETVPVFVMRKDGADVYIIENDNLQKLMKSQHINVGIALNQIKESLQEELDASIEFGDLVVTFTKEDIEALQNECLDDPTKIDIKCEAISLYNDFLNQILSEGAKIFLN